MPKALTVPAAWEASQDGQMGLEGKTPEIRRQYYTKLGSWGDVSLWTGGSFWFSHGALQHQACSGTGSTVPHRVRGGTLDKAARSQHLLSEATRHLI